MNVAAVHGVHTGPPLGGRRRAGSRPRLVSLLDLDRGFALRLTERERNAAHGELMVPTLALREGERLDSSSARWLFAVLVTDGVLGMRTSAGNGRSLEILTSGCVLRPAEQNPVSFINSAIFAITASRVAILDARVCAYPAIADELVSRLCERTRSVLTQKAIDSQSGIERRVLFCLWHLAERCGRCRADGIELTAPLTHELLADVMGAARPSVTSALARLTAAGFITRTDGRGWLLRPDSVEQLFDYPPPLDA